MILSASTEPSVNVAAGAEPNGGPGSSENLQMRQFAFSVGITSNSAMLLRDLAQIYPVLSPSALNRDLVTRAMALHVRRISAERAAEHWVLDLDGQVVVVDSEPALLGWIEYAVEETMAEALRDYVLIHAGVIARGEGGIVVPGGSGAGKSTLVAALNLDGFRYFSDEIAVVDGRSSRLYPFPKAICLKEDGIRVLSRAYPNWKTPTVVVDRTDGQRVYFLDSRGDSPVDTDVPVRYVIIPNRRPGVVACLESVSRAGALLEIARQSLNLPHHGRSGIEVISRIVEEADCYRLTYDNLRDAVETVSALTSPVARQKQASRS